jgi:hypothetical protein
MDELKPRDSFGKFMARHGMYGTRLYHIWNGLSGRCLNPNNKDYANYGERGIGVCDEWRNPEKFFEWAFLNGYGDNLTLDRIDTNKGYSPNNCRWITWKKQQRNKRNNRMIEYNGEIHCVAEWAEITGIAKQTIVSRLRYGWTPMQIFTIPPSHRNARIRISMEHKSR